MKYQIPRALSINNQLIVHFSDGLRWAVGNPDLLYDHKRS